MDNFRKQEPFSITAQELADLGEDHLPDAFCSSRHLIYSSPATLAFNSPGAEGFGVKRAGLAVPGSVMLIVSPGCCGRNTSLISRMPEYENRFFYLNLEEKDVVTGRHLRQIPAAVQEVYDCLEKKPSVMMICITCVDALLGTDMERVCRKAEEKVPVPVKPCYMYALTREGSRPPMVHVRQSLYSLLSPTGRRPDSVNILGYFSPLEESCELPALLGKIGVRHIRQIGTCETYEEFLKMSEANFTLLLHPEGRFAAADMANRLGIPYIELTRLYDIDRNARQYASLSQALHTRLDVSGYREAAEREREQFCGRYRGLKLGIGECLNGDPFELALSLTLSGLMVREIYGTVTEENRVWMKKLAGISPETRIYSNLEPTMLYYEPDQSDVEFALGKDARYYHPDKPGIDFNRDVQPFGFGGIVSLYREMGEALEH